MYAITAFGFPTFEVGDANSDTRCIAGKHRQLSSCSTVGKFVPHSYSLYECAVRSWWCWFYHTSQRRCPASQVHQLSENSVYADTMVVIASVGGRCDRTVPYAAFWLLLVWRRVDIRRLQTHCLTDGRSMRMYCKLDRGYARQWNTRIRPHERIFYVCARLPGPRYFRPFISHFCVFTRAYAM